MGISDLRAFIQQHFTRIWQISDIFWALRKPNQRKISFHREIILSRHCQGQECWDVNKEMHLWI